MSLINKVEYRDKETIISAENLNEIQDAIITLEEQNSEIISQVESMITEAIGSKIGGSY